jgi:hypothetical protein
MYSQSDKVYAHPHQFIVAPRDPYGGAETAVDMTEVVRALAEEKDSQVLRVWGKPERPMRLTVQMTDDCADRLKQRFAGKLIVEVDAPLTDPTPVIDID